MPDVTIGIDLGTSGARAVAADPSGKVVALADAGVTSYRSPDGSVHEQSPEEWWLRICEIAGRVGETLRSASEPRRIAGITVTSTSGSLVLASADGAPIRACMLYDDRRANAVLDTFRSAGEPSVNASYSLAKALWVLRNELNSLARASHIMSPADWLAGRLTGSFGVSDYSNALKLGYDFVSRSWTKGVAASGVPADLFPRVVAPGSTLGAVSKKAAEDTGLPEGTPVLAGATDGLAGLIASGAAQAGDRNTTLGTTLIWKALCPSMPKLVPSVYCHLHPTGLLAPGAASNTGPGCFSAPPGVSLRDLDTLSAPHLPSRVLCYLLPGVGERFPLADPAFRPFTTAPAASMAEDHAARLQSVAFIERWGYEVLEECGIPYGDTVYSTGGAAASPVLSALRASVLRKRVARAANPFAAFGAAILAAGGTHFGGDFQAAISSMTELADVYEPDGERAWRCDELYEMFRQECRASGRRR